MPDPQPMPSPEGAVPPEGPVPPDEVTVDASAAEMAPTADAPAADASAADASAADAPVDAAPADAAVPSEDELLRTAVPATVRHAPRYSAFLTTGALAGLVVGLLLAVLLGDGSVTSTGGVLPFLGGSNGPRLLSALAGAVLGLGIGAGLALWADRRSLRR